MATSQESGEPAFSRPEPAVTAALEPSGSAAELVRVLDDYLADLQAGNKADRTAVLAAHPQLAGQLEHCLAGIEFIHRAGQTSGEVPAQLGDFRIRREIGRGGMGVVFEAEQLSLHRIVALKILRFGIADEEALNRFRHEAETVAKLQLNMGKNLARPPTNSPWSARRARNRRAYDQNPPGLHGMEIADMMPPSLTGVDPRLSRDLSS
jgi:hypothetical protein